MIATYTFILHFPNISLKQSNTFSTADGHVDFFCSWYVFINFHAFGGHKAESWLPRNSVVLLEEVFMMLRKYLDCHSA